MKPELADSRKDRLRAGVLPKWHAVANTVLAQKAPTISRYEVLKRPEALRSGASTLSRLVVCSQAFELPQLPSSCIVGRCLGLIFVSRSRCVGKKLGGPVFCMWIRGDMRSYIQT